VMPFGLTNAPSTFQGLMNEVFRPYLRKFVLVFFDDILVYSRNIKDHLRHLQVVLEVLQQQQLYAKLSKCDFGCLEVEYLGHLISEDSVMADPAKIEAVVKWPVPRNPKALKGFLGLTGYYRKFVKGYGGIAAPLTCLLRKDSFGWNDEAEEAFQELKEVMTSPLVLGLPDFSKAFIIKCDALGAGIGDVLMQEGRPLDYLSQGLKGKNLALSTYENELLALVMAVRKWRHYLLGQSFRIRIDQQALKPLLEQRVGTPAQQKWVTKLLGFDFQVEYKCGRENKAADALSRVIYTKQPDYDQTEPTNISILFPPHELASNQAESQVLISDSTIHAISTTKSTWMEGLSGTYPDDPHLKKLLSEFHQGKLDPVKYHFQNGFLFYKGHLHLGSLLSFQKQELHQYHDSPLASHMGMHKTYSKLRKKFYWPGLEQDVRTYIRECDVCQRNKVENL
jgi:hypothetical protein